MENGISANATSGTLSLTAGGRLATFVGPITGSAITLTANAGDLDLVSALATGGSLNSVTLTATAGTVSQVVGALSTGSLSVAGNAVSLGVATNSIGTLANASVAGGLSLADSIPLTLSGTVATGGTLAVTDTGGGLAINGYTTVGGLSVALQGALTPRVPAVCCRRRP